MFDTQVVIIGVGPFGLSISVHLSALGVDHLIVGRTNNTYHHEVRAISCRPMGSTPWRLSARHKAWTTSTRVGPVTRDRFVEYVDWYTERLVPGVQDVTVAEVTPVDGGFRVSFADAAPVSARRVVVATGVIPYHYLPAQLGGLPDDLLTHTAKHIELDDFKGVGPGLVQQRGRLKGRLARADHRDLASLELVEIDVLGRVRDEVSPDSPASSAGRYWYGSTPVATTTCRAVTGAASANVTRKPPSTGVTSVTVSSWTPGTSRSVYQSTYSRNLSRVSGPTRST